jgi:hypothetical protein
MKKERTKLVVVSILLGVVINVVVAWGLAAFISVRPPARQAPPPQPLRWPRHVPEGWPEPSSVSIGKWWCCTTIQATGHTLLDDPEALNVQPPAEQLSCHLDVCQWGWPMRAMEIQWPHSQKMLVSIWLFRRPTEASLRSGLPVSTTLTRSSERTHLPLMPVWPGFAVNTLLYGAFAGLVLFAPGATRRMLRHRRGACIACGYDLAGLGQCPECGKHAEARGSAGQNA